MSLWWKIKTSCWQKNLVNHSQKWNLKIAILFSEGINAYNVAAQVTIFFQSVKPLFQSMKPFSCDAKRRDYFNLMINVCTGIQRLWETSRVADGRMVLIRLAFVANSIISLVYIENNTNTIWLQWRNLSRNGQMKSLKSLLFSNLWNEDLFNCNSIKKLGVATIH